MKKIILLFVFFMVVQGFAQTNGISYQAIIMNPKGEQLPGVNNANSPVVNKDICMVFKFVDEFSNIEYQETVQTKTDGFGMVNLVIGKGTQTAGYAASFRSIVWSSSKKSLIVGINTNGNCDSYTEISNQEFSYAPLAFSAINAENVTGVVAIENGGTNAVTVLGAKTNLQLENVDNTTDLNKPVSTATQTALNLKENTANKSIDILIDGISDIKYPSVKSVKMYVDGKLLTSSNALTDEIARATTAENTIAANLVTETNNRTVANTTLTANLATEVTNRTAADVLKEDVANKSTNVTTDGTSDIKYPSVKSVKTYVDTNAASSSTALANEITRATAAENTIAANLTTETSARTSTDATLTSNLSNEVTRATAAENTIAANLATETAARTSADATLTSNLLNEVTRATAAENTIAANLATETSSRTSDDATLTSNLSTEVVNRTAADLQKEDLANKSTNVTTDGTSDIKYPSVKSVKTYVDANAASSSTALANEVTRATAAENTIATNLTAETSARTSADATLTTNLATEVSNRTSADLLKEDLANKSIDVTTDGTSDTKYPSVKSVKTYVDAGAASVSTALANEITRATTAENTIAANLTAETSARTSADNTLTTNLSTETAARTSADAILQTNINAVQTDVDANEAASNIALNLKAPLASPTFTGTVSGITKTMVGLGNIDDTSDLNKPVSTATQTALNLKVDKVSGERLINASEITKLSNQSGTNTGDQDISGIAANTNKIGDLTSLTTTANSNLVAAVNEIESGKAPLASPTFTGTVSGITKSMVGLGNVDNISDANKPVSTATQTALNLKANLASPTFTGTVSGIDKTMVGLDNVDNISDANKPVSTATQTALNLKANLASPTLTGTPLAPTATAGTNNTQIATTAFVTTAITGNFVDLTTGQTIAGNKIFSSDIKVNGITVGLGSGSRSTNVANGYQTLFSNTSGFNNTAVGSSALYTNVDGNYNTAIGASALRLNTDGGQNTAVGIEALQNNTSGYGNTAVGRQALGSNTNSYYNTAIGLDALAGNITGTSNTAIGKGADVSSSGLTNATAIGNDAKVNASNKIQLGNTSVTSVNTSAAITAASFIKTSGTSSQFLKADGSVDSNTYLTTASGVSTYLPLTGGTLTGGLTGTTATLSGNTTIGGTLGVTGNLTASGTSNTVGTITSGIWNAGALTSTGTITGTSIVKSGGTAGQYLMANGTVSTLIEVADEFTATAAQTSFTLTQTPSTNSKVKMYVNGIRISNTAYSISGTTLTYIPANNGAYALTAGDRIQMDFYY